MIPLLFPLVAFVAGIAASSHLDPRAVWICCPLALLLAIARRPFALIAIFLAGSGLRSLEQSVPSIPPGNEASRVIGTLLRRPEWRGLGVYVDLDVESIDGSPYRGRARLTEFLEESEATALFEAHDLGTGDRVEILVRLRRPTNYRNPGVFDFRRYLERQGIFWTGTIRNPRLITVLQRGPAIRRAADTLRDAIERRLSRLFADDRDVQGLVLGMVLGRKQALTMDVEEDFQDGGLYHMVVVSGFNLAVIAAAAGLLSRFLSSRRNVRLCIVVIAVIVYTFLVGAQPPVTRAAVMVCIVVAGRLLDRDNSPLNTIAFAAIVLLTMDPASLADASLQMTFVAVAAVAGIGMPVSRWMLRGLYEKLQDFNNVDLDGYLSPEAADWRVSRRMFCEKYRLPHALVTIPWRVYQITVDGLIVSLAVELVFVGFMVESFHRLSPVSPLLNVPAGLVAAAVTPLGLLLIVTPEPFAGLLARIVQELIQGLLYVLDSALSFPYATLRVPSIPLWLWAVYSACVLILVFGLTRKRTWLFGFGAAAAMATQLAMFVGDFSPAPPKSVTVTILDVGQGDSILVEFPDGRRVLIDGGGVAAGRFLGLQDQSTFSIGEDVVSAYLFSRGIRRLDVVVLTHAHNDHLSGLFEVLENFEVGELWLGRNPMIPAYRAFIHRAQERGVPLRFVAAGDHLGELQVMHPPRQWRVRTSAENNDSVVLLLRAGGQTALFTGDLELPFPGIEFVNLLKVSHHGSKGVRMRVKSDVRVISVGPNNPFGHPHPSSLPALRTDLLGAIQVKLQGPHPIVEFRGAQAGEGGF
jgi:competence protein ComEC